MSMLRCGSRALPALIFSWALGIAHLASAQAENFACGAGPTEPPEHTWQFVGPRVITNGQTNGVRTDVTGRVNSVAANPFAPATDVWVATAGGGVWHLERYEENGVPAHTWTPMTDDQESLATGALVLDNCSPERCATVWVGGGENSIRRDTHYGAGVLRGVYDAATDAYEWTQLGAELFRYGSISALVIDPTTTDNTTKTVYVGLTSGVTADATHSTVTTTPAGSYGIYKSTDAGASWSLIFSLPGARAADLEIDPLDPQVLYASFEHHGLWRTEDAGVTWNPIVNGIDTEFVENAAWPELAVHRPSLAEPALLYAVMVGDGGCPPPHSKSPPHGCRPAVFRSDDAGDSWVKVLDKNINLNTYETYLRALAIHPTDPDTLWFGGVTLRRSDDGGATWSNIYNLHPDHHGLYVWSDPSSPTGVRVYAAGDGGLYVGDGATNWDDSLQDGLAVALFQSISTTPGSDAIIGGLQDNGTNMAVGFQVWDHINDGDAASTIIDSNGPSTFYDVYIGNRARRCTSAPYGCGYSWPSINAGLGGPVAWYPPFLEDPTALPGGSDPLLPPAEYPLYFGNQIVNRSIDNGSTWGPRSGVAMAQPIGPDVDVPFFPDINSPNVITAIAPAPTDPAWVYIGMYDGRVWRTTEADLGAPSWTAVDGTVLPDRPVTSIAVHPIRRNEVYVAFGGLGDHSVYRSINGGDSWSPWDQAIDGSGVVAERPANRLVIEPESPYRVWLGTDSCVYSRTTGSTWVYAGHGMPNAAVYDFHVRADRDRLYAATHGRGVWLRKFDESDSGLVSFLDLPICCWIPPVQDPVGPLEAELVASMSISAIALEPNAACTMSLEEANGNVCSTSETDADGGTLFTDAQGALVVGKEGFYLAKPIAWACHNGVCAGGVPAEECQVAAVTVECGRSKVRQEVTSPSVRVDPTSALLKVEPLATAERVVVGLAPTMTIAGKPSSALCEVEVAFDEPIGTTDLLDKLATVINDDDACREAGVQAHVLRNDPGAGEDAGRFEPLLQLRGERLEGSQLVPAVTRATGVRVDLRAMGLPLNGQPVPPRLTLTAPDGALGGVLRVTEVTKLGRCTFEVPTERGDDAASVAERLATRFLMAPERGLDGVGTPSHCPNHHNPRDVVHAATSLQFPLAHGLEVETTDPGLLIRLDSR